MTTQTHTTTKTSQKRSTVKQSVVQYSKRRTASTNHFRNGHSRRSNPFSNSKGVNRYHQYVARRRGNGKSSHSITNRKQNVVGGKSLLSNMKNVSEKLKLGLLKFKNKSAYIGAVAALGGYINKLNYRQGTSMGDGTCGLCSGANIATAIKMLRAKAKGGSQGLQKIANQISKLRLPKKLEYAMMRKGRHVSGGGTTHGQQIANMKRLNSLIGDKLGLKQNIYGGAAHASKSFLDKVLSQGRLAQINIRSGGLFGGGNMVRGGIDHAIMIGGMRINKDGSKQYAVVDSSGARAGRGMQWIRENQLAGGRFDITYTKPLAELVG